VTEIKARYGLERPYILWTGTMEPRKNLPRLLHAFGKLAPDMDLVLVGPKGWKENIDRLLAGQRPDIKILGFMDSKDLSALYAGADVFCFPSLEEGFGLPVLEAMAQGTPVVTSLGTSTEELGMEGLRRVLEDPALRAQLSEAGRQRANDHSWTRTAQLTAAAYREAAG
jgi:glycosyltransferase involved in cell wall biosynthesis